MRDLFAGLALGFALFLAAGCSSTPPREIPDFETFEDAYEWVQALSETPLFVEWRDLGDRTVELVCTDRWKWRSDHSRGEALQPIFEAWAMTDGTAQPVFVRVVDRRGQLIDSIWGLPPLRKATGEEQEQ